MSNPLPAEVEQHAERGWCLHPLKTREKVPLLTGWPEMASSDPAQLREWARQFPDCNWGVATGKRSGLFVVDCDGDAGLDWLRSQVDTADCDLPESWAVTTERGLHLYFGLPSGTTIRTSQNKVAVGVDIRGDGGFVVVPPSIHPSGKSYVVVDDCCPVSPAPAWLLDALQTAQAASPVPRRVPPPKFENLPEGNRNSGLASYGGQLRAAGHDASTIEGTLQRANASRCQPPLGRAEVSRIAESIKRYVAGDGADGLTAAWEAVQREPVEGYTRFLLLGFTLHNIRGGEPILLPLGRLGDLFGCHETQISRWRARAERQGILRTIKPHIPHRNATVFEFHPECIAKA